MRAALTFLRAHTLAGVFAGAVVGLLDGLRVLTVSEAPASLGALVAPAGLGVVLGLGLGALLGVIALLLRLDPEVDGDQVVERWPARLIASGTVGALLAAPLYLAMSIPVTRFADDVYRVAGAVLVAVAALVLAGPLTTALSSFAFRRLRRFMPRRSTPATTGTNGRWAALLAALVLVPAGVAWFATDIEVALGAAPFIGGCALVAAQLAGVLGVGRLERSRLMAAHPARLWIAVPAAALLGALAFASTVGAEPGRTALLGASLLVPRPLQLVWRAADRDSDGYAALLGGGDCDDGDPAISPVAIDLPGNGLDEDCSGADAHALEGSWAPAPIRPTPLGGLNRPRNLVLITIEALRYEAVELGPDSNTPGLASLASTSTFYNRAYAPGPATHLTLSSLMTGRYPRRLAWKLDARPPQERSDSPTLAELLRQRRYSTYGFATPWVHRYAPRTAKGFGTWETAPEPNGSSAPLLDKALAALARQPQDQPWFLWIHLVDPHWPHQNGSTETLMSGYRAEVATADKRVGRLLETLEARADFDRTLIVVTGDHGEALGAHGVKTHGVTLYEHEVRVPLLIHVPGAPPHRRADPVSLVDLMPTLLDGLGVPSAAAWDGRSLLPAVLNDAPAEPRVLFVESWNPLKPPEVWIAAYTGPWKLLRRIHTGQDELYDVVADPDEVADRRDAGDAVLEGLKLEVSRFTATNDWAKLPPADPVRTTSPR